MFTPERATIGGGRNEAFASLERHAQNLRKNPTCTRCLRARSTVSRTIGGQPVALCDRCSDRLRADDTALALTRRQAALARFPFLAGR
jgi:hypothetical protein